MPTTFNFYFFGPPRLRINDDVVILPPQPAAFCSFLVLNRQRRITREEVQVAFWPDAEPSRAQERLRRTLYLLRKAINPHTHLVATEGSELAIAPDASLWIDYEAFEKILMDAHRHDPPHRNLLEQAINLYKDDLLTDIYADWVLLEREHARQQFLTALRQLLQVCQHEGDWPSVIRYALIVLEHDPFQEVGHRALMMAYAASGDRSAAIRQYQQCVQLMRDELDTDPLPETIQLYESIRQGQGVASIAFPGPVAVDAPVATNLEAVPLVGRKNELAEITTEWRVCQRGHSRLVLVTGSAGMGKTRLVSEAASHISGPGTQVITGHCYAMEAGTPYQLIAELMHGVIELGADELSPGMRSDLAQLVPALRSAFGEEHVTEMGLQPDATVRLQEAVTQAIRLLAATEGGLWLVTEDLHWADPASLACLNHALRRCHDLPLMVLATLRDEEVSFDSPIMDWPTNSVHAPAPTTRIQLAPLQPEQLNDLLVQVVADDTSELMSLLHLETAGNPFFVVETLRALVEQNILYAEPDGSWQIKAEGLPEPTGLPMSDVVLRVIQGRIRRLSRAAQEVLTVAAVVEHDIDEKLLVRLVDPSLALDLALDEILRASILAETAPGIYQFNHIKVREIIYADTSAPRRRFLHRRAAETLVQWVENVGHERLAELSQLAYHYAQAREWTPALVHGWRAAHTAFRAGALAEANRYAAVAQTILADYRAELVLGELPEKLSAIEFDLLSLRAEFRRRAATAGLYYPPELMTAIEALLPEVDDSRRAQASLQQSTHLLGQGDLPGSKNAAARGRALYAQLNDQWGEVNAIEHQIDLAYRAGDLVTMRALLADLRHLSTIIDSNDVRHMLTVNEMRLAAYQGNWMRVLHLAQTILPSHQSYVDPAVAWLSLANLGLAYMKLGAYEEAYTVALQAVEASENSNVLGLGARVLLARLELLRGEVEQARDRLLAVLETPDPMIGESEVVSPALALVRCCVAVGDDAGAKQWSKRASAAVSRIRLPILFPLSQIAWALTYLASERYDDARKRLVYPLELMLLLADSSPQEIFALRAAAARGLGNESEGQKWLIRANDELQSQVATINDAAYRASFLNRVAVHRLIIRGQEDASWQPEDVLR